MSDHPAPRCKAITKAGAACRNPVVLDSGYCKAHTEVSAEKRGFGGSQPGAGRPRLPRPTELAIQRIEERLGELIDKHLDLALRDPDPRINLSAGQYLVNRALGTPAQRTEVSGPGGGPVSIAQLMLSLEEAGRAENGDS